MMFSEHEKHEQALLKPLRINKYSRPWANYSKGAVLNQRGADRKAFGRGNLKHFSRKRRHIFPRGKVFERMVMMDLAEQMEAV